MSNIKFVIRKVLPNFLLEFLLNRYHFLLAFFGAAFYGFPSKKLIVIGVTGTDGKSTTVNLITKILEETNYKVASLSSIRFKIHGKEWPNTLKMTMPGRFKIQKFLKQAVNAGCQYAVLEITSEGIKQHRHRFINFNIAVFTNLTAEHIESHGSFEKYRAAKEKLFQAVKKIHILNLDDENAKYFLGFPAEKKYGYGLKIFNFQFSWTRNGPSEGLFFNQFSNPNFQTIQAKDIKENSSSISFIIHDSLFKIPLIGGFNVSNALAAICVGLSQGVDLQTIKKGLEKISGIPGRMEAVIKNPFQVFVDYAHTPNALKKVYQALTTNYKLQIAKLICVFGACGGGRDKWKRPIFGKIAARYCSQIILTNEDPYDENPFQILSMIKSGMDFQFSIFNFYEILDRREAIKKALSLAKPNDVVVITGKGCEPWMCVSDGKKIPWSDKKIVKEEFKKLNLNSEP
jgi:UDP-N-acetylmuramoyl-L-alanyl-D-glutamate--2,6-diaminopimelate ligase